MPYETHDNNDSSLCPHLCQVVAQVMWSPSAAAAHGSFNLRSKGAPISQRLHKATTHIWRMVYAKCMAGFEHII